jgi:dTMP kinase
MAFFTFEGIDGSGKSSLLKNFADHLKGLGLTVEMTREPGGSELGRELRQILLKTTGVPPCPESELLLYEADRAQHVAQHIKPWLEKKAWVLSDRFGDSSVAFQGAGRHIPVEKVKWLNEFATQGLLPDMTIVVDCPVEESVARREKREREANTRPDRFESEISTFHQAVRNEYLKLAKTHSRFFVLDGTKDQKSLLEDLITECKKRKFL